MDAINIYPMIMSWKKSKQGVVSIGIAITINNRRVALENLHQRINSKNWDKERKRVKDTEANSGYLNAIIENRIHKLKTFVLKRQALQQPINKDIIVMQLTNGAADDFYTYAESVIKNKKLADGQPYSEDTKRRYSDEIVRIKQYKSNLTFADVTVEFLEKYKNWLLNDYKKVDKKNLHENSVWKALAFIRMVYNEALREEIILPDSNPFRKFKVGTYKENVSKIKYLEMSQVEAIEKILLDNANILDELTIRIGWRFLAMCVLGMRISDSMNLNEAYFNNDGDLEYIPFKTRRHGNKAQVPITADRQRNYLNHTLQLPLPETNHKSFRTTFNEHLKILAALAGIKHLTSHMGRHTMGSLLVDANVNEKAAMAILGVKSERVIKTYTHLKKSKLRLEANKLSSVM